MTRISRSSGFLLLVSFFLFAVPTVQAQRPELHWKPVGEAGGYKVEIRDKDKKIVVSEEVPGTSFVLNLAPGDYEVRVTTLDKLRRDEESTAWTPFSLRQAVVPVASGVRPRVLEEGQPQKFILSGTGFSETTELGLFGSRNEEIQVRKTLLPSGEIEFSVLETLEPGTYVLVLRNPPDQVARLPDALTILPAPNPTPAPVRTHPPAPVPTPAPAQVPATVPAPAPVPIPTPISTPTPKPKQPRVLVGGGYGVSIPLLPWSDLIAASYRNFETFVLVPLSSPRLDAVKSFGPFLEAGYSRFGSRNATSYVSSNLDVGKISAGGFFDLDLPLTIRLRLAPGLVLTRETTDGDVASSLDFSLVGGASLVLEPFDPVFLELGSDYWVFFYSGTPLQSVEVSLRTGLKF